MAKSVHEFLKEQRLPLVITALALLLALSVGLVPVLKSDDQDVAGAADHSAEIAALEERLAALETAAADDGDADGDGIDPALRAELDLINKGLLNQTGRISRLKKQVASPADDGDGIDPALRAELDLINKGLLNQTGRVSRLKKQVASPADDGDGIDPALRAELDLINKGLLNQTGRISRLKKQVATPADDGDGIDPALRAELDLINKGLLNQTGRVSGLKKQVASLSSVPARLERIDLEVINLTKAVGNLHRRLRAMKPEGSAVAGELIELRNHFIEIQDQVDGVRTSIAGVTEQLDASVANGAGGAEALPEIEAKLDQILKSITK